MSVSVSGSLGKNAMIHFLRNLWGARPSAAPLQVHAILLLFFIATSPLFSDVYRAKKGDTLLIVVIGQPEYTHSAEVRADGRISYFGGDLEVAGETITAINTQIQAFLVREGLVNNPVVLVSPVLQENSIFVGGAVKLPGRYPISPTTEIGLYRAIALAGGMAENADPEAVILIRAAQPEKVETYDLSASRAYRDIGVSVNDLVFVMSLRVVEIQGEVKTPGTIFIQREISIAEALARAGGPTPEADLTRLVKIAKNGTVSELNRAEEFWQPVPAEEAVAASMLADGETLYVPNAFKTEPIYITGQVRVPGAQRVRGPLNLPQAIALSGGFEDSANREVVTIRRRDGTTFETRFLFSSTDETKQQVLLYPGDTLEVAKKFTINWGLVSTFGYIVISGVTLILNLTQ